MPVIRERRWWTDEEDEVLRTRVQLQEDETGHVENWNEVANVLPGRTNKDCRKRWSKIQAGIRKGAWTRDEDERLKQSVEQQGVKWSLVAKSVRTRNADQCAKRWQHVLGPGFNHSAWTTEDDQKLLAAIERYGNNWKHIGMVDLPDRSSHDIRNRSVVLARRCRKSSTSSSGTLLQDTSTQAMGNDTNTSETDKQSQPTNGDHTRSERTSHETCAETTSLSMSINDEAQLVPRSEVRRKGLGNSTGRHNEDDIHASHTINDIDTGTTSSAASMWDWSDLTTDPAFFGEHQISTMPDTSHSSEISKPEEMLPSVTAPSLQTGFTIPTETIGHEPDLDILNHITSNADQTFQNPAEPFNGIETISSMISNLQEDASYSNFVERKGYVTIILRQVDARIAQDIMSNVLRYNDSLVIRLLLE